MRRRKNNPNDIFGIDELLDSWMDMMSIAYGLDANQLEPITKKKAPRKDTMSYEDRDKHRSRRPLYQSVSYKR